MKNDSNTIIDFYMPFPKCEAKYWQSHYKHNGKPFRIHQMQRGHYILEIPIGFLVQFKQHKRENEIRLQSFEDAQKLAHLIFKGKAGEVENTISFCDFTDIVGTDEWIKSMKLRK